MVYNNTAANHVLFLYIVDLYDRKCVFLRAIKRFWQNNYRHIMTDSSSVNIGKSGKLYFTIHCHWSQVGS